MDRRQIAGWLGLILTGCAQGRAPMPEPVRARRPVELGQVVPIAEAINRSDPAGDPAARRASTAPDSPTPAPSAEVTAGRPAPFADRAGTPRLQGTPRPGTTDETPGVARPAPYADRVPDGPRPQAPPTVFVPGGPPPIPDEPTTAGPPPTTAAEPKADPEVAKTSAPAPEPSAGARILAGSSGTAATVGSEIITLTQLRAALKDQLASVPPERRNDPEFLFGMTKSILDQLIERTLLVQAAKKQLKDPKAIEHFNDAVDKAWIEHELPPLLRETKTANIHELRQKFLDSGRSLDQLRDDFRQNALAREYMMIKVAPKLVATLPEKQKYYSEHVQDFQRPAQYVWREIAIDTAKSADRDDARRKIDALNARLAGGEDFARLAKAASHGATAREGGRWEIAPGSYAIPGVNEALAAMKPGETSGVIEAPGGFHIVRLESRREAGPARFDEVQDQVKEIVIAGKQKVLFGEFIDRLRAKTLITTCLDRPATDPGAVRTGGESPAHR